MIKNGVYFAGGVTSLTQRITHLDYSVDSPVSGTTQEHLSWN